MPGSGSPNESKLLCLPRSRQSAALFLGNQSIAVQIGARISKVVLIDSSDTSQLLIFLLSFTDAKTHSSDCLNFLQTWDDKDQQLQTVFVNRMLPEMTAELPKFSDKYRVVDFKDQIPKAASLIADLAELQASELFYPSDPGFAGNVGGSRWTLIHCDSTADCVIRISPGSDSGHSLQTVESVLNPELHSKLSAAKGSLAAQYLSTCYEEESLNSWLMKLSWLDQTEKFREDFAIIVQPALKAFADVIRTELQGAEDQTPLLAAVFDSLFVCQYCRDSLITELKTEDGAHRAVRFVRDIEFLGMLGSLANC
ncbi:hypothetical protein BOX15_Mlig022906g2 [Macrostomum lignano]|uniref:Uncharacterized protein n=2 Tax=Macrostomum lignano TaxID=282301 RepID=A0A267FPV6_9PLAT|nr:hypothetical protein BOX15_Mlig022906g3 [Macrostomum lignano]PAA87174.1 hypothetical protein BOX15_Mlig022906g2 [Macrostomum lignano]